MEHTGQGVFVERTILAIKVVLAMLVMKHYVPEEYAVIGLNSITEENAVIGLTCIVEENAVIGLTCITEENAVIGLKGTMEENAVIGHLHMVVEPEMTEYQSLLEGMRMAITRTPRTT